MKKFSLQFYFRLMLLVSLLLLGACTQTSPSPPHSVLPTYTPSTRSPITITATPMTASASNVEIAPKKCPLGPPLHSQKISAAIEPLAGSSPVWATVGEGGIIHLEGDLYDSRGGWPIKIVWEVGPHYGQPVTLRAGNLLTGALLTFDMSPDDTLITTPVLDPRHPGHPVSVIGQDWNEWGSVLLIPNAGCYYIEATWSGGHWRNTFAAGL